MALLALPGFAATDVSIPPIPAPIRSGYFTVTINGHTTPVVHAVSNYYFLSFDYDGPATISVRAPDAHYWDRGVEIQPMRYGIRPLRRGAVITFPIPGPQNGPVKLVIARPGDHFVDSQMLFLFGNSPDESHITASTPGIRYYGPGVHHENIDAHSGDRIYLAPGAVIFGALNLWQVHDVRVFGRGILDYNGPQNPHDDTGWIHRPNWHCIVMDHARNIEIDGLTCIVHSRTWQIQMVDSRHLGFYNVNVIGGNPNNANQDGMDFLATRDATVRDCFIRASDDDFALIGNWGGYTTEAMRAPGGLVANIDVENSVLSTSISNTIRIGWPQKTFQSANVTFRNLDVLHTGYGACMVPFAFFEMWTDPFGVETHSNYRISDIRLEDYYSLFQIRQPHSIVHGIVFSNIAAMEGPPMVPSVLAGSDVHGISLKGVRIGGIVAGADAQIPLDVQSGTPQPVYEPGPVNASFSYAPALIRPHQFVTFRVDAPRPGWQYHWLFGDGTAAVGAITRHAFPDAEGTLLDGSGRFRVLLRASRPGASGVWASRSVVVARTIDPAVMTAAGEETAWSGPKPPLIGWKGWIRIPWDGGYTITLLTSRLATFSIDDLPPAHSPELRSQVCGSPGNAVQATPLSAALRAGLHWIRIDLSPGIENEPQPTEGGPALYWEGPQTPLAPVPVAAEFHLDPLYAVRR
ncbi:MAG TPA: hypothetical protein VME18_11065 [Acidobacteriaceae bacterium]|nr:hypothetical protein [Acidobacteriaceae bacterium]